MRITAGSLRGRVMHIPPLPGLRPTPAKVRQALFNILHDMDGIAMLDLYAGSGLMALEAISRGAGKVLSVEMNGRAIQHMRAIRADWRLADAWQIFAGKVDHALESLSGTHFDLIFADPPYVQGLAERLPARLDACMVRCSQLVIEEASRVQPVWPAGWLCTAARRYGDTTLHFLQRSD